MNIDRVHPDLRPIYAKIARVKLPPMDWPGGLWFSRKIMKAYNFGAIPGVAISEQIDKDQMFRVCKPDSLSPTSKNALLLFHGGGLIGGHPKQSDLTASWYAATLGVTVISPTYRVAPEHPWPAAIDDCWTSWLWLQRNANSLGIDPNKIAIGGISAGGGLAACLAQRIVDNHEVQPVAQMLIYPMLDDRTADNKSLDKDKHFLWNNRSNRFGWSSYLSGDYDDLDTGYKVAARRDDLKNLPPCWIGTGDIDLFYEENKTYAARLKSAGVKTQFHVCEGAPHGFDVLGWKTDIAEAFRDSAVSFMGQYLR